MGLSNSTSSKASGGDGIPTELFKILKVDAIKVLYSVCQQNWKSSGHRTGKKSIFIPITKKGSTKECSNYWTIALISHASKVMLKILQSRLHHYVNWEIPDVQAGFRKGRGTRDQIANIRWITEKAREFQKNICFINYAKAFDCVDHNKLENCTCLLSTQVKKQQLEPYMEKLTGPKLRKVYKSVHCHPVYLVYKQGISCKMPGWMSYKLESRLLERYKQPQICR